MEPPNPQSTEWIAGNSRLFSRSLQLEHKWNKTRKQLEHNWNTHPKNGTQLVHAPQVTPPLADEFLQNGTTRPPVYRMDCWKLTAIFQEPPTGTQVEQN